MRILKPNTGGEVEYILKDNIFVQVTDFGLVSILKEILIGTGNHNWYWIALKTDKPLDIRVPVKVCTFDHTINKAVNDRYATVYQFQSYKEMAENWDEIKYVDTITTVYKSKAKEVGNV